MNEQNRDGTDRSLVLAAPGGLPFPFAVRIRKGRAANEPAWIFWISAGENPSDWSGVPAYTLPDRAHRSYLDLFEKLAADFGLRLPQNRRPAPVPAFRAAYREVLRENLAPGMLYGYGDPAVLRVEAAAGKGAAAYYLLATSNDAPDAFPILRSSNLEGWTFVGYVFPQGRQPAWAATGAGSDYWAPELHRLNGAYSVYFVARAAAGGELCIGTARSAQPDGPFLPGAAPLLKGNVIDPHVFVAEDGTAYLYWKEDNNDVWPGRLLRLLHAHPQLVAQLFPGEEDRRTASLAVTLLPWAEALAPMERFQAIQVFIEAVTAGYAHFYDRLGQLLPGAAPALAEDLQSVRRYMKTPMYAQQLTPDGAGLTGARVKILENDLAWEAHLVEGMWVTQQEGRYYLFYAGNDFSTDQYGIGVAVGETPLGPFRKMERQLLQSTESWWAPGHPSVVEDPDGKPLLFLHAYHPGKAGYKQFRALLSIPVHFRGERVVVP